MDFLNIIVYFLVGSIIGVWIIIFCHNEIIKELNTSVKGLYADIHELENIILLLIKPTKNEEVNEKNI